MQKLQKRAHYEQRREEQKPSKKTVQKAPPSSTPSRRELKWAEQQTAKPETAVAPDSTRQRPATPLSGKELYAAATSGPQLRRHHARNVLGQAGTLPVNKIKDGCVDEKSTSETTASPMSA